MDFLRALTAATGLRRNEGTCSSVELDERLTIRLLGLSKACNATQRVHDRVTNTRKRAGAQRAAATDLILHWPDGLAGLVIRRKVRVQGIPPPA